MLTSDAILHLCGFNSRIEVSHAIQRHKSVDVVKENPGQKRMIQFLNQGIKLDVSEALGLDRFREAVPPKNTQPRNE